MITRRDLGVALVSVSLTLGIGAAAQQPAALLPSSVFLWESVPVKETAVGSTRQFLRAPTATLDELEIHVTTLNPGQTSHAPHQHPNEELLIVKEGTVEALVNGEQKRLGTGSVIFQASNQLHGIRNVGAGPATYHVVNWSSPGMLKKKPYAGLQISDATRPRPRGPGVCQPRSPRRPARRGVAVHPRVVRARARCARRAPRRRHHRLRRVQLLERTPAGAPQSRHRPGGQLRADGRCPARICLVCFVARDARARRRARPRLGRDRRRAEHVRRDPPRTADAELAARLFRRGRGVGPAHHDRRARIGLELAARLRDRRPGAARARRRVSS